MSSLIDQALLNRPHKRRAPHVLYATDLVKPCIRSAYLDIVSPKPFPVETLRIFEAGNILEDYWVKVLEGHPDIRVLETQLPAYYVSSGLEIHGRVDSLCQHQGGVIVAHEIKTAKSLVYTKTAKPQHVEQLQFYLGCLEIEFGQIDYIDKGVMLDGAGAVPDRSFSVKREPAVFGELINKAETLKDHLGRLEPPQPSRGWLCNYCLHREECEKD